MDWFRIHCESCGYETELVVGTPSPKESFDLNEDFSQYVPVLCDSCDSVISLDLHDKKREASCPCGGEPKELSKDELLKMSCPSCGAGAVIVEQLEKEG